MAKAAKSAAAGATAKKKSSRKPKKDQAAKDAAARTKRGTLGLKKTDEKATKAAKAAASRAEPGRKMPSAGQLQSVLDDVQGFMDKAKSLNGKGRARISEAVSDFSLNNVAFSMVRKMIKVGTEDPNKLMVLLEDFDHYRAKLKIDDLAGPGLFQGTAETADDGEGDDNADEPDTDTETEIPPTHGPDGEPLPLH